MTHENKNHRTVKLAQQNILEILKPRAYWYALSFPESSPSNLHILYLLKGLLLFRPSLRYYCWKYTLHKRFFLTEEHKFSESRLVRVFHCTDRFNTKFN